MLRDIYLVLVFDVVEITTNVCRSLFFYLYAICIVSLVVATTINQCTSLIHLYCQNLLFLTSISEFFNIQIF